MARNPREISRTGLYHIMFRGISPQNLFKEKTDFEKMLEIISRVKEESELYLKIDIKVNL